MRHAHKQPFTGGGMRKAHNVPGFVQRLGRGAENLALLLDYEDPYDAGLDLPNLAPNSSIDSLTNNNNAGVETASPIVGQQSGDYEAANNETHSRAADGTLDFSSLDLWYCCWVETDLSGSTQATFSIRDGPDDGLSCVIRTNTDSHAFGFLSGGTNNSISIPGATDGNVYFQEGWYTRADTTAHARVNDGTESTNETYPLSYTTDCDLILGNSKGFDLHLDGRLDQVMLEIAPQGELFWPDHSTWLYNGSVGRSSKEILEYNP